MAISKASTTKKVASAKVAKPVKPAKSAAEPKAENMSTLQVNVYDLAGTVVTTMTLPETIFGAKINPSLMTQAIRVYQTNQYQGTAMAKTRGQVTGSTKKMGRQKGGGRARHGSITAPIYVGGGKAHGPQPRTISAALPKKMRKAALFSALSAKMKHGDIIVMQGLAEIEPKTKIMAKTLQSEIFIKGKKQYRVLMVVPKAQENIKRAAKNLQYVDVDAANLLHTYEVIRAQKILLMPEAIKTLEETFIRN